MGLVSMQLVKLTLLRIGVFSRSTRWQLSARRCDYVVLTRSANAPHRGWNPQTLCLFLMCLSVWNNSQLQRVRTSAAVSVFSLLISHEHVAHWERGQSGCFGQKQLLGLYLCSYPVKPDLLGIFFLEIVYFQALPWSATLDPPTYVIWFQPHLNCSSSVWFFVSLHLGALGLGYNIKTYPMTQPLPISSCFFVFGFFICLAWGCRSGKIVPVMLPPHRRVVVRVI